MREHVGHLVEDRQLESAVVQGRKFPAAHEIPGLPVGKHLGDHRVRPAADLEAELERPHGHLVP